MGKLDTKIKKGVECDVKCWRIQILHIGDITVQKVHEIEQWKGILLGGKVTRKNFQEEMNE